MNYFHQIKKYFCGKIQYWILTYIFFLSAPIYAQYKVAEFYNNIGISYYFANQLDSALYCFEQAAEILKQAGKNETKDKKNMDSLQIDLLKNMGVINNRYGKYDLALNQYFNGLALAEKNNKTNDMIEIYLSAAGIYTKMSNSHQGEAYYLKAEKLCREINDSTDLTMVYQGLSGIYINKKDYSSALKYGEASERILSALPDIPAYQLMYANQELTDVWLKIPDYDKALKYAQKTVEYAKQTGISSYLATALFMLSSTYLKQNKYKESEKIALEALAADTTDVYINSILYQNIAEANIGMGNSDKGIEYYGKTTNAIRAYSNNNFQSSLSEMEVKYETEKKELKITALEKENRLMTGLNIAGGVVLLSALTTFFFLWRWMIQKKRVAEQQKQLAEQQVKQLEKEKQLVATQAVLDGETQERARLARDLHDGLGSMLTGAKLNLLEMKKDVTLGYADAERFDKAVDLLDRSVYEMRRVAHHLMPDALSRFGLKPAVSDFCSNLPSVSFAYYGDESRLDPKLEVMIYRSIHELVNNALKYAGAGEIMVQIMQEPSRVAFTVQDDGCGFDPSSETGGMGLQNIRNRVASYNGIIDIHSKTGEGTEVNVELRVES